MSVHPVDSMEVNGLTYYFIDKGVGKPLFLLHGFPDRANTWDAAIAELSGNYRCIAPFLRGYYPTSIPEDADYRVKTVATDIAALADGLGIEKFSVIGQDWGASITYALANLLPERIEKIVTIAIPHPAFLKLSPRALYKARHFIKFRKPKSALDYTRKNDFAYIDKLFRRWSPNWSDYSKACQETKATYALEGRLEAALGYYWSLFESRGDLELSEFYSRLPSMPTLTFVGKKDGALTLKPFRKMQAGMPASFKMVMHDKAGHFLHREVPELFLEELKMFLEDSVD